MSETYNLTIGLFKIMNKYRKRFQIKDGARKHSVTVSWIGNWENVNVYWDRQYLGTISNKEELEYGKKYSLDSGSEISVQLTKTRPLLNPLIVTLDDVTIKEHSNSPTNLLTWSVGALMIYALYSIIWWLLYAVSDNYSFFIPLYGLTFLICSYFIKKKHSRWALSYVLIFYLAETITTIILDIQSGHTLEFPWYMWRFMWFMLIVSGFKTIYLMNMDDEKYVKEYVLPY